MVAPLRVARPVARPAARLVASLLSAPLMGPSVLAAATVAADADPAGVWPLRPEPELIRGFDPPGVRWASGHRGVDLLGHAGQRVHAALAGRVTYAGMLAGRGVVVVGHGVTRTTYEPLAATVTVGEEVAAGGVLGRLEPAGSHCPPQACLHWGWLRGDTYLDPLGLVDEGPVRLLPLWRDEPANPPDRLTRTWRPALAWPGPYSAVLLRLAALARSPP